MHYHPHRLQPQTQNKTTDHLLCLPHISLLTCCLAGSPLSLSVSAPLLSLSSPGFHF